MPEAYLTFWKGNGQVLELTGMATYDPATETSVYLGASANLLLTIQTKADGLAVAGLGALPTLYRSGSSGEFYYVFVGDELTDEAERYQVWVHGDDGFGVDVDIVLPLRVRVRRSSEAA